MPRSKLEVTTSHGVAPVWAHYPDGDGPWPAVVMFTDALGVRETSLAMADRLAQHGYFVLLPDVFYRMPPADPPFVASDVFNNNPPELERLIKRVVAVDETDTMADLGRYLDVLAADPRARGPGAGVVGYCMGGGLAIRAAVVHPQRIAAAASIHGGRFLVDPQAPEQIATRIRAAVHIAVAEIDQRHTAETSRQLEAALIRAGVPHSVELYPGSAHGFAVPDLPPYNQTAAEHHWERITALFRAHLA